MERVIKFRAWHRASQKMHEVVAYCCAGGEKGDVEVKDESYRYLQAKDIEVMQFTGLLDKYGKEIYEGDVYRNLDNGFIGHFYYLNGPGGYTLYTRENNQDGSPHNMLPFMQLDTTNFEVIGNIYENPELLHQ